MNPFVLALAGLAALAALNALLFRSVRSFRRQQGSPEPRVSVLVPARNEARNLERLLPSLGAQTYGNLEILVLDDHSSDSTLDVIRRHARRDSRLVALEGRALPHGWLGKPHACAQLSRAATGELLVFTDADTEWAPDALERLVAAFQATRADALCAWPEQVCSDPLARLVQPLQQWSFLTFMPLAFVPVPWVTVAVAANGQLLAFRREAYARIGGHDGVRASVIEDMALARAVKRSGGRFALLNAHGAVRCEMYSSEQETWAGFAKNTFAAVGASPAALLAVMACVLALVLGPWLWLARNALAGEALLEPALAVALSLVPRLLSDWRCGYGLRGSLLHPLSVLAWAAIGLESWRRYASGRVAWKDRTYDLRRPESIRAGPIRAEGRAVPRPGAVAVKPAAVRLESRAVVVSAPPRAGMLES